ncbi:MAG: porin family protein [Candidatus Symbiothrix sp.]|nr:porin family protein [Candidatus Symbiothrix sp.]
MKRLVLVLVLAVSVIGTAQAQFSWGIKGGVNLVKADFSKLEGNLDTKNLTGFQLGPMIEFTVPLIGVGMDAALLYSQDGFKFGDEDFKTSSLFVPVNLKYKLSLMGLIGAYGTAGPYINIKLDNNFIENVEAKSFGAGLNFGFGVEILSHLQLGANYQLGLTEDYSMLNNVIDIKGKSKGWSITAAYLF